MSKEVLEKIQSDVASHRVILYMKGSKQMPLCGFSARVVNILNDLGVDFETRDILKDERLRQAIKEFSNWPTLPQLYINGQFVGGCDIVTEMHRSGQLQKLLEI